MRRAVARIVLLLVGSVAVVGAAEHEVHTIRPGPDVRHELQGVLIEALPGDVIQLEAGLYRFDQDLLVTTDNLTIRGRGTERTRLSFRGQNTGSKGIEVTGDSFVIEDLAIEDTVGNGLKIKHTRGVTVRRVRVEWTGGPSSNNGAYGVYPVQCDNVLIEKCIAIGASDAGIYVGQSRDVVVRGCRACYNVVGIEIENCLRADVHDNVATNNAGGVLVVDLPGLEVTNGKDVRVFRNRVVSNNHENFAPEGNVVGTVPPGTGIMVLATDRVEIFENHVEDHRTLNLSVLSYLATQRRYDDPTYDPYPEGVSVHDNVFSRGGTDPAGSYDGVLRRVIGVPFPDILFDGILDTGKFVDGKLPEELGLRLARNGQATFANINFHLLTPENIAAGKTRIERDQQPYVGALAPLPAVTLAAHTPPDGSAAADVLVYRNAPQRLSDYGLLRSGEAARKPAGNAGHRPAAGVIPYTLNTELFADYKTKHRLIKIPGGTWIGYRDRGNLEFPVGTIIAKTFAAPADLRDKSRGERFLETRILMKKPGGWYGLPYVWNDTQTDAKLRLGGGDVDVTWIHQDGTTRSSNYLIPNASQCKSCHETDGIFMPLGLKTRNVNGVFPYPDGEENQLAHWSRTGVLRGAPSPDQAPRVPALDDPSSGTVEQRARAWLDVNCAHCHNPLGPARSSALDLRLEQNDPTSFGVWKAPVAAGRGSGKLHYGIVPGRPEQSILVYRINSTEPGIMMPELPRRLIPVEGLAVVREWIRGMKDPRRN